MKKKALITGITGQDGSYLAVFLLEIGYVVPGIIRKTSLINTHRIDHIYESPDKKNKKLFLYYGDLTDALSLQRIIIKSNPNEIYNLAAQSHVAVSFEEPEYTANSDALGTLRILEIIKNSKKKLNFIKQGHLKCLEKFKKIHNLKIPRFIPEAHMLLLNCILIG